MSGKQFAEWHVKVNGLTVRVLFDGFVPLGEQGDTIKMIENADGSALEELRENLFDKLTAMAEDIKHGD